MTVTPVLNIEWEPLGAYCILRKVNDRVYICPCSVRYKYYICKTKHALIYDSHFKHLHEPKGCGAIIDNRSDSPICVMGDNDIETNIYLKHALKFSFGEMCIV